MSVVPNRWLLPDGVDDVLPPEAAQLEALRRRMLDLFAASGYELIMPPLVEYLDALLTGSGSDLDLKTFKVTDQPSGRMLGIRADVTSQAARIDAHSLARNGVTRLCYAETVAHARGAHMLASRVPLRVGAELFGASAADSDLEIISLLLDALHEAGLRKVHLEVGDVGLFRELTRLVGLDAKAEAVLLKAVQGKAYAEVERLASRLIADADLARLMSALPRLIGDVGVLDEAEALFRGLPEALASLQRIRHVVERVAAGHAGVDLLFDLSELRGFDYHTGIVFAAYVDDYEHAIARGGRYDKVGALFGRARPATGFDLDLKELARIVPPLAADHVDVVWVEPTADGPEWLAEIRRLRRCGHVVVRGLKGERPDGRFASMLQRDAAGGFVLVPLDAP